MPWARLAGLVPVLLLAATIAGHAGSGSQLDRMIADAEQQLADAGQIADPTARGRALATALASTSQAIHGLSNPAALTTPDAQPEFAGLVAWVSAGAGPEIALEALQAQRTALAEAQLGHLDVIGASLAGGATDRRAFARAETLLARLDDAYRGLATAP